MSIGAVISLIQNDDVEAQIASPERFVEVMQRLGIGDEHLVVAYDSHPASQFATRLWWALNYYGHAHVVVLNGGLPKWKREQRPLDNAVRCLSFCEIYSKDSAAIACNC